MSRGNRGSVLARRNTKLHRARVAAETRSIRGGCPGEYAMVEVEEQEWEGVWGLDERRLLGRGTERVIINIVQRVGVGSSLAVRSMPTSFPVDGVPSNDTGLLASLSVSWKVCRGVDRSHRVFRCSTRDRLGKTNSLKSIFDIGGEYTTDPGLTNSSPDELASFHSNVSAHSARSCEGL